MMKRAAFAVQILTAVMIFVLTCELQVTTATARALPAQHPGDLVSVETISAFSGASAWKVVYLTTDLDGKTRKVSGVIIAPSGPSASPRPVVAWAHPTTGVWGTCAPSLRSDVLKTIPGLQEMIARGWVVTATDYPGLGTPGTHPYFVGISEARAVIDSVRAARNLPQAHADTRFAAWGHSQGGHAALFTGILAAGYAPELKLVGVAAAAPGTELEVLLRDSVSQKFGQALASYVLWSWARVYNTPLSAVVTPKALAHVKAIARICIQTNLQVGLVAFSTLYLTPHFFSGDIYTTKPWADLIEANEPDRAKVLAPIFIAQGTADEVVRPHITGNYVNLLCSRGENVTFLQALGVDHHFAAWSTAAPAVAWMADRFAGKPLPRKCTARTFTWKH